MPNFCRHGRLLTSCPICSKSDAPTRPVRSPRTVRERTSAPRAKHASGMRVRRVERAADDGYDHELVSGLRATADAARLADELAFAEARLAELSTRPGLGSTEVAAASDPEEACWLAFLIALIGPGRGPDAFAPIAAARTSWASGEEPDLDGVELGQRAGRDPQHGRDTLDAYRTWADRSGGQHAGLLGEPDWEPERRFGRTFERLALPGLHRGGRFELLVSLGALGVVPLQAGTLMLGADPRDAVVSAAKRVFGIGDPILLEHRARDLAHAVGRADRRARPRAVQLGGRDAGGARHHGRAGGRGRRPPRGDRRRAARGRLSEIRPHVADVSCASRGRGARSGR